MKVERRWESGDAGAQRENRRKERKEGADIEGVRRGAGRSREGNGKGRGREWFGEPRGEGAGGAPIP